MKQVGISDSHMCMVQLLFSLANNPTGHDGYIGEDRAAYRLSKREYLTKDEAEQKHKDYVEEQIKLIQMAGIVASKRPVEDSDSSSEQSEYGEEPEATPSSDPSEPQQIHTE